MASTEGPKQNAEIRNQRLAHFIPDTALNNFLIAINNLQGSLRTYRQNMQSYVGGASKKRKSVNEFGAMFAYLAEWGTSLFATAEFKRIELEKIKNNEGLEINLSLNEQESIQIIAEKINIEELQKWIADLQDEFSLSSQELAQDLPKELQETEWAPIVANFAAAKEIIDLGLEAINHYNAQIQSRKTDTIPIAPTAPRPSNLAGQLSRTVGGDTTAGDVDAGDTKRSSELDDIAKDNTDNGRRQLYRYETDSTVSNNADSRSTVNRDPGQDKDRNKDKDIIKPDSKDSKDRDDRHKPKA